MRASTNVNWQAELINSSKYELFEGFWKLSDEKRRISYPDSGNELCFALEDNSYWFRHRNNMLLALLERYVAPSSTFFDIGGGNGAVSSAFQRAGQICALVEPGEQGVRNALNRGVQQVICSRLEDLPFKPGSMDHAGAFDVIEHIENDHDFVTRIQKLLTPGGYFFSTVPSYQSLWSQEDIHAGHFRRYTLKSYRQLLEKSGFELVWMSYFFLPLVPAIYLLRALPFKLGVSAKNDMGRHENEHNPSAAITQSILNLFWNWELNRVKQLKNIFTGSSIIAVARKKS